MMASFAVFVISHLSESFPGAHSEPYQASYMDCFAKIDNVLAFKYFWKTSDASHGFKYSTAC